MVHSFFFVSKVSLLILLACNFLIISTTLAYTNEHAYLVTCRQVYKKRSTIIYLLAQEHKRLSFSISFWLYKMRFIFSWFLLVLCARFIFFLDFISSFFLFFFLLHYLRAHAAHSIRCFISSVLLIFGSFAPEEKSVVAEILAQAIVIITPHSIFSKVPITTRDFVIDWNWIDSEWKISISLNIQASILNRIRKTRGRLQKHEDIWSAPKQTKY